MESQDVQPVDEDWDINDHRGSHESDEHWELRRRFLEQNKGRYAQLRLLSLSQVFVNMEFLGCKYPEETMDLVNDLSIGIVEEYRQARAGRLQRTFVKASDAAEKKSKGRSSNSNQNQRFAVKRMEPDDWNVSETESNKGPRDAKKHNFEGLMNRLSELLWKQDFGEDLKELVLVEHIMFQNGERVREGPMQVVNRSCAMSKVNLNIVMETAKGEGVHLPARHKCKVKIGTNLTSEGEGMNKDKARAMAAGMALQVLRQYCFTIQMNIAEINKNQDLSGAVHKTEILECEGSGPKDATADESSLESKTNTGIGAKLLKMMGWKGGGLGKDEQGIEAPIDVSTDAQIEVQRNRLGLGHERRESEATFGQAIETFLKSHVGGDLVFSSEFSIDERRIIHSVAGKLGLKGKSRGKGDKRFLTVSPKRRHDLLFLVKELLENNDPSLLPKYNIILPLVLGTFSEIPG